MNDPQDRIAGHAIWKKPLLRAVSASALAMADRTFLDEQLAVLATVDERAALALIATVDDDTIRAKLAAALAPSVASPPDARPGRALDATAVAARELVACCATDDAASSAAFFAFGVLGVGGSVRTALGSTAGSIDAAAVIDAVRPLLDDAAPEDDPARVDARRRRVVDDAVERALELYARFVDGVHLALEGEKSAPILARIRDRKALWDERTTVHCHAVDDARTLYASVIARQAVEFTVDRLPFDADVIDARVVRIPAGRRSELHRHAHESVFFVMAGEGEIRVGSKQHRVRPGDAVFAPRWTMHQSTNTGPGELVLLGITDFYLTSRVQIGGRGEGRLKKSPVPHEPAGPAPRPARAFIAAGPPPEPDDHSARNQYQPRRLP